MHRFIIFFLLATCAGLSTWAEPAPTLETAAFVLRFDADSGALVQFEDKSRGHGHLAAPTDALWALRLAGEAGAPVTPGDAGHFSWETPVADGDALALTWSDFGLEAAPDLAVRVTVAPGAEPGLSRWEIAVEGLEDRTLSVLHFPRLEALAPQADETLAVAYWMGEKTTQARRLYSPNPGEGRRQEWLYPGIMSMQLLTLYSEGGSGLYLAADDTEARSKGFAVFGDGEEGLGLELTHYPGADSSGGRYAPGYSVLLGTFQGDWITAAEIYREWALEQDWARQSRLKRGLTPQWVRDTGFWVWNRGRSPGVLPPAVTLQDWMEMPVSVFWHWWHGCAYDVNFPEYLPPREGTEPFREALSTAQDAGIHAIVYMNQRLWGMTAESWETEGAARYAVKRADGEIQPEVYNTFTQSPMASMCMGTEFWRDTYAGLTEKAVQTVGVDGIYMDQACSSLVCYDTRHGHAPGGGTYWMEGFRSLESDIRERSPGVALAGEGTGEAWLPHLDLMLSLQVSMERYAAPGVWEPIPLFHAVYHGYAVFYGNYASLTYPPYDELWPAEFTPDEPLRLLDRKFVHQFRLEQARTFVWGQQPCLSNFLPEHLETRAEEMRFLRDLAQLRMGALDYLLHGTFVRPPAMKIPTFDVPISRLSIYAGQRDAVQEYRKEIPQLLTGAWRAGDGGLAVAIANISDAAHEIQFTLNTEEHGLPEKGTIYKHSPGARHELGRFSDGHALVEDTIEGAGACIYEFVGQ